MEVSWEWIFGQVLLSCYNDATPSCVFLPLSLRAFSLEKEDVMASEAAAAIIDNYPGQVNSTRESSALAALNHWTSANKPHIWIFLCPKRKIFYLSQTPFGRIFCYSHVDAMSDTSGNQSLTWVVAVTMKKGGPNRGIFLKGETTGLPDDLDVGCGGGRWQL